MVATRAISSQTPMMPKPTAACAFWSVEFVVLTIPPPTRTKMKNRTARGTPRMIPSTIRATRRIQKPPYAVEAWP